MPYYEPSFATSGAHKPGSITTMSAVDQPDADAITVDVPCRHSYRSSEPLKDPSDESDKVIVSEQSATSTAQGKSEQLEVKSAEPPTGADSPGYTRVQIMASNISLAEKVVIFLLIMVLASAHSLDNFLRGFYEFEAGMQFDATSKLAALNSISFLGTASLTPMISKNADIFGRPETLLVSTIFYVLGTSLQANSYKNYTLFCAGYVLWTIGFLGVISMFEIVIADFTSIRVRVIMWYLPAIPYLVTPWISATIMYALHDMTRPWPSRYAGSAIAYSVCASALIIGMFVIEHRVKKRLCLPEHKSSSKIGRRTFRNLAAHVISRLRLRVSQMDILGCILLAGFVSCILGPWASVPIMDKEKNSPWRDRTMIIVICAGILCASLFYFAERFSKYPMFPVEFLKEKSIRVAIAMGFLYHLAFYCQNTYLYIELTSSYNVPPKQASWIIGLYPFTSTLFGLLMSITISISQDFRWYLRIGAILFLCSTVLQMIKPAGTEKSARLGIVCSQLVLGIAGGLFPFSAMGFMQAGREHAQLSTLIGVYMTACRLGGGVGQAIVGAIWINVIEPNSKHLINLLTDWKTTPESYLFWPGVLDDLFPWDTPVRKALVEVHMKIHRYVCVVGVVASIVLVILAFYIKEASFNDSRRGQGPEDDIELQEGTKAVKQLRPSRHPILF